MNSKEDSRFNCWEGHTDNYLSTTPLSMMTFGVVVISFYFILKIYKAVRPLKSIPGTSVSRINADEVKLPENLESIRRLSTSMEVKPNIEGAEHPIYRICLTGGPCAGKTTSLTTLMTYLANKGFRVLVVPEAATLMNKGGCFINTENMTFSQGVKFQISLMKMQMNLENIFIEIGLTSNQPCVILMDRGVMDGSAYVSPNIWKAILNETGWTTIQLRDRRYDAVCHLVTAADGAEEFYGMNNEARYETVEQARATDLKLIAAYTGHPQYKILDNNHPDGFKGKINSLLEFVSKTVGLNQATLILKKYLIETKDNGDFLFDPPADLQMEKFEVEEIYLYTKDPNTLENKIRSRGRGDSFTYAQAILTNLKGEEIKRKRQITAREYVQLQEQKDPKRKIMLKDRYCFIYNHLSYIIDVFKNLDSNKLVCLSHNISIGRRHKTNDNSKSRGH